jgi:polyhydroxyalkanoate synthase
MITTPVARPPAAPLTLFPWLSSIDRALRVAEATTDTRHAPVGQTAKRVVWARHQMQLFRYDARTAVQHPVPLLLVHSLVSRSYILDLIPGNSFVEFLLDQGFDIYLTDWGVPTAADASLALEDYVLDFLPAMVEAVRTASGAEQVSLLGYCMGGLLTLLYAATHPGSPVRNLLSLATPVDFDQLGLQGIWARQLDADRLVAHYGNIPAAVVQRSFQLLKPASEFSLARALGLWQHVDDARYVAQYRAFDRWSNDHIDFPGAVFRQTLRDLVQSNKLVRGGMELDGLPVDLSTIGQSFLAIAAEADHIVPLAATRPQMELVGSADTAFLSLPGGHVGLAAGRHAKAGLWPRVADWLTPRSGDHAPPVAVAEHTEPEPDDIPMVARRAAQAGLPGRS